MSVLLRARSATGKQIIYRLGKGGMNASAALPCDASSFCDCSGFVAWCLGISRWIAAPKHPWHPDFPSDWLSTDSIHDDATKTLKRFRQVMEAKPGDLYVYPDSAQSQGHVGVIGDVYDGSPSSIVHCSAGNFRQYGDAIRETPVGQFWRHRNAIIVRPVDSGPHEEGFA